MKEETKIFRSINRITIKANDEPLPYTLR